MTVLLLALSGIVGAAGVILAAAAAHGAAGSGLDGAAMLLLVHAAAILAGVSVLQGGRLPLIPTAIALAGWALGAILFGADIALRTFAGHRLFPMATPTGGTILIAAWFTLTGAAICALLRRH